jgi:arsenate reductase
VKIADLAAQVGIASSAVRWYESVGVLPPASRGSNGYREYREDDVARLRLVVGLRQLGLEPAEAGRLARICLDREDLDPELVTLLASQRIAIARRRDDLDRLEGALFDVESTVAAVDRLQQARADVPSVTDSPIRVLFVCTGNSGRSQIAEALLSHLGGRAFEVRSAGTTPRSVSPHVAVVLAERGIDWAGARSKSIDRFLGQRFDYVITVCDRARETCPVFPGSENTLHWGLDDPAQAPGTAAQRRDAYRRTRDELVLRLRPFVEIARRSAGRPAVGSGLA